VKDRRSTVPHVLLKVQWFAGVSRSKRQELFLLRVSESGRSQRLERERAESDDYTEFNGSQPLFVRERGSDELYYSVD